VGGTRYGAGRGSSPSRGLVAVRPRVVPATGSLPPGDPEEIDRHSQRRADEANARVRVVGPAHRDLVDSKAELRCEHDVLGVVGEPVDPLPFEQDPSGGEPVELESALRIAKPESRQQAQHQVEGLPGALAVDRLSNQDLRRRQSARADRDVDAPLQRSRQLSDLVERRGHVRVHQERCFTARDEHACPHGGALASVARKTEHAQPLAERVVRCDELARSVGRAVVDDDHLVEPQARILEHALVLQSLQEARQPVQLVECRNDHRQRRLARQDVPRVSFGLSWLTR
jgi:hypothetical protein